MFFKLNTATFASLGLLLIILEGRWCVALNPDCGSAELGLCGVGCQEKCKTDGEDCNTLSDSCLAMCICPQKVTLNGLSTCLRESGCS
uniref:TIL domain-containing protein n=1 Tax=Glossina austeni TaxID=7395 RepID=A0A1A9VSY4_GLOAU